MLTVKYIQKLVWKTQIYDDIKKLNRKKKEKTSKFEK